MKLKDYTKSFDKDSSGKLRNKRNWLFCYLMIGYLVLVWAFFFIINNFESFYLTFIKYDYYGNASWYGLGNFKDAWNMVFNSENSLIAQGFLNSIKLFVIQQSMLPITLIFCYLMWRGIPGFRTLRILIMLPNIISGFIMTMVSKQFINGPFIGMLQDLGLNITTPLYDATYSYPILIFYSIWTGFGGSCLFYTNAMKEIDDSLVESYRVDGVSGMFGELWHICLPNIWGTLSTFIIGVCCSIFLASGPQLAFYMYDAPSYVYTSSYFFTLKVYTATNYSMYPVLSAFGWMITLVTFPFVRFVRFLIDKYGPSED